jgi:hypothetical protein
MGVVQDGVVENLGRLHAGTVPHPAVEDVLADQPVAHIQAQKTKNLRALPQVSRGQQTKNRLRGI